MKWDLYNKEFIKTGKVINEEEATSIPDGLYHLTINAWIINDKNELLLIKKSMNYNLRYPGSWTTFVGNVESEKSPEFAVFDILQEKFGIDSKNCVYTYTGNDFRDPYHYIYSTFIILKNVDLQTLLLDELKYSKAKWANLEEIQNMIINGEIEFPLIERIEKYIIPFIKSKK